MLLLTVACAYGKLYIIQKLYSKKHNNVTRYGLSFYFNYKEPRAKIINRAKRDAGGARRGVCTYKTYCGHNSNVYEYHNDHHVLSVLRRDRTNGSTDAIGGKNGEPERLKKKPHETRGKPKGTRACFPASAAAKKKKMETESKRTRRPTRGWLLLRVSVSVVRAAAAQLP